MNIYVASLGTIFTIFSTAIISYVSMATMVGPWIAPTLVLISSVILRFRKVKRSNEVFNKELGLIQSIGSVGGAVGMALGFSMPTLYFLDAAQFKELISSPIKFSAILFSLSLAAGGLGIWLARILSDKILNREKLPFPVSSLIYNVITSQTQFKEAKAMLSGLSIAGIFCFLRDGILSFKGFFPRLFYVIPSIFGKEFVLPIFLGPTYLAIGFTSGMMIALPLFLGLISRYLIIYPINFHANYLPWSIFQPISIQEFTFAFCSGLVFAELAYGLRKHPKLIFNYLRSLYFPANSRIKSKILSKNQPGNLNFSMVESFVSVTKSIHLVECLFVLFISSLFFFYANFSFLAQLFIVSSLVIATYQICILSAKSGLVPFGRFATFIMIPSMFFFKINYLQITFLCVFVSVCVCVASDLLFDYKVGELCGIERKIIHRYQWFGLVISALCIGLILWLFFNHFQLGSAELCGQRGQTRALLVQLTQFNYVALACGFFYGLLIMRFKISAALMMGGILMSNSISIGLITGGLLSKLFKKPQDLVPFWSGIFAFECLWILVGILLKIILS